MRKGYHVSVFPGWLTSLGALPSGSIRVVAVTPFHSCEAGQHPVVRSAAASLSIRRSSGTQVASASCLLKPVLQGTLGCVCLFEWLLFGYMPGSTLAWKIPWAEEPGGPLSMGSPRVGLD